MRSTNFKTENNSLRKLLGNGLFYKIPRFQRDYSWTLEQWEDLWTDISNTIEDLFSREWFSLHGLFGITVY